ncbi:MAG: hypothetical protein M3Q36_01390 [bacterium]|nr:hypothetical protein [bacterium]
MIKTKPHLNVLKPSQSSSLIIFLFTLIIISPAILGILNDAGIVSNSQEGFRAIHESILQAGNMQLVVLIDWSNRIGREISTVLFWALTGFVIYSIIFGFTFLLRESVENLTLISPSNGANKLFIKDLFSRAMLRTFVIFCWIIYLVAYFGAILPSIGRSLDVAADQKLYLSIILVALLVALSAHIHVVFLRLFFLRLRLFGITV